jgi:hypothetical protein
VKAVVWVVMLTVARRLGGAVFVVKYFELTNAVINATPLHVSYPFHNEVYVSNHSEYSVFKLFFQNARIRLRWNRKHQIVGLLIEVLKETSMKKKRTS